MTSKFIKAHYLFTCDGCGRLETSDWGETPQNMKSLRFGQSHIGHYCEACAPVISFAIADAKKRLATINDRPDPTNV